MSSPAPTFDQTFAFLEVHEASEARHSPRHEVLKTAKLLLENPRAPIDGYQFDDDPVGFVRASFWKARIELVEPGIAKTHRDGAQQIYQSVKARGEFHRHTPQEGDLVFFDISLESSSDEAPKQVAIVERVQPDGTIVAVGRFSKGPARIAMNLRSKAHESPAKLFRTFADPY